MGGVGVLKKILEKNLRVLRFLFYLWRVGGFVSIYTDFLHNIA